MNVHFLGADATSDDAMTIAAIVQSAFAETTPRSTAVDETSADILGLLRSGEYVAVVLTGPDGMGTVRYRLDGDAVYFGRLAVLPEHRGRGIGSRLLDEIETIARILGAARLTCSVRRGMESNMALYARRGFIETGGYEVIRDGAVVSTACLEKKL